MATVSWAFGVFPLLAMLLMGGGTGLPMSVPPLPEEPLPARIAPEQCLFYMSFSGTAQPDPKSRNQTEQLLAEPEVRYMMGEIERVIIRAATAGGKTDFGAALDELDKEAPGPGSKVKQTPVRPKLSPRNEPPVGDMLKWGKLLLTRPLAVFVSSVTIGQQGPDVQGGAALNAGADAANLKAALEKYQTLLPAPAEKVEVAGISCYRLKLGPGAPPVTWGTKGKWLLVGVGEGAIEGILQRAAGSPPKWLAALRKQLPVERVSTVTYVNVKKIIEQFAPLGGPHVAPVLSALGLDNVTALTAVTGLDREGFVSRSLLGVEGEPAGVFQLAAARPLTAKDLAPIPYDATIAVAARVNPDNALETMVKLVGKIEPRAQQEMTRELGQVEEALGIKLRDDVLQTLGDAWCAYNSPSEGGFVVTGLTLVVPVKDHQRLAATHARLLAQAKAGLRQEAERAPNRPSRRRANPRIEQFQFAGQEVYFFNAGSFEDLPFAPAWCLTEKELIVAAFPQQIKSYLSRGPGFKSLAAAPGVAELFEGGGPLALTYVNMPKLLEVVYPLLCIGGHAVAAELAREGIDLNLSVLPSAGAIARHLRPSIGAVRRTAAGIEFASRGTLPGSSMGSSLPMAAGLLLPAVSSARDAARRAQSMNNLRQISLAMLNYEAAHNGFPPAYIADKKTGKPLLSWRVAILPYIEQQALYEQFHLDEPWDSENNKKLAATVISVYRSPGSRAAPNMTNYLTVRGKDTAFPGKEGTRPADITDGMSNTIMVVEASDAKAVPWTKPDDFQYDEKQPMAGLLGLWPGGFQAALCDGSVRFISATIDAEVLRRMFKRNDGQMIDSEKVNETPRR
jgi:hypothetical protein